MSAAIPPEKVTNLGNMTLPELRDLLQRQERLVANQNFVKKLPDKGAKIMAFIERIQAAIKTHAKVDETADLFQKMALDADTSRRGLTEGDEEDVLGAIVNPAVKEKKVIDERADEHAATPELHLPETYVRVINKSDKDDVKEKFRPNRGKSKKSSTGMEPESSQKTSAVSEMAPDSESKDIMMSESSTPQSQKAEMYENRANRKLKHRYDDSLEETMRLGEGVHESTKVISIEESVALFEIQKQKQTELQNRQAMERLAQRLNIKMAPFDPEGSRIMAYRDQADMGSDDDDDSNDSEEEKDYPDQPTSTHKANVAPARRLHSPARTQQKGN